MGFDLIHGAKGGGSTHTPVEAPDTLRSISFFQIEDLLSEGEIGGLVNGLQSVKLDGTPVANADGTLNFAGVSVQVRTGTQDQSYIPGYGSVKNEIAVSTELKSNTPWVRALTNTALSAFAVTLQVDALQKSNTKNGDINGYMIQYAIDVSTDGGAYQTVLTTAFNGKASVPFQRTHRVDLPKADLGWNVRVRRLTPNANSATTADTTRVVSITEIIDAKLRYPNTAYVAISGDASQFSNIPVRSYVCWGRTIRVPTNYDPATRAYAGVWDGSFKIAWTDNPAWILYDLVVNDRYGIGDLVDASLINKWELYRIAQYCDQLVADGKGGQEPRYRCTAYLQSREDAFRLLGDIASVFSGVSYWMGSAITTVADMPQDPVYTYTASNVIDGRFTYQSSARKTRFSTALVTYNDPANSYKQAVEYVADNDAIARYGVQPDEFVAFGCTSQGQAHRRGLWALTTSQYETDSVTFAVGLEGLRAAPGQIIRVQDPKRAGMRQAGRLSDATAASVTVDREPGQVAVGDTLTIHLPDGTAETRTINTVNGRTLGVGQPFTAAPVPQSVWSVESAELVNQTFRILSVSEDSGQGEIRFTITAVQHNASKFAHIDNGATIQIPPISQLPTGVQKPATNVRISGHVVVEQGIANNVMTIEWDAAESAVSYKVEWQKDNGQWIQAGTVSTTSLDVVGIYTGTYIARVTAFNSGRTPSLAALSVATDIVGKTGEPPRLTTLTTKTLIFGIGIDWTFPPGAEDSQRTEIWASTTAVRPDDEDTIAYHLGDYAYPGNHTELHGLSAGASLFFWGRIVDKAGNVGGWYPETGAVNGQSSSDAGPILEYLTGQITKTQLAQELAAAIDSIDDLQSFIEPPTAWDAAVAYSAGAFVSHNDRLWLALESAAAGVEPGTDPEVWRDVGAVSQTAAGLALAMSNINVTVEELDGQVQATAEKTESVYAQLNPKKIGADTGGTIGGANDLPPTAGYFAQTLAQVSDNKALGKRLTTVQAQFGTQLAGVTTQIDTLADGQQALASQITTVQATAGAAQASAQLAFQTAANIDGRVSAALIGKVGVTTDGKYYQAGFAVGIDNSGGTVQSQFLVTADLFGILPSAAGGNALSPFVVVGGQVFINQAFIGSGWITNAMIGDFIQSTDYIPGQRGWRISKSGNSFELNGSNGSGRLSLTNNLLQIFDSNATLRFRAGLW
ncbi:phage tail protein [Luteibacter sp. SG786]|uniref:TipJ family phage tail tip protein n=1 Tax=Luteibacter sp. SG786 TaxID=2587130 RepID=UPI00141D88A1|nr:phage tail protein [Luteibacter sp. SG786]NII53594.1 putative phage tail protein [Luteibacter sp. SG786]